MFLVVLYFAYAKNASKCFLMFCMYVKEMVKKGGGIFVANLELLYYNYFNCGLLQCKQI